MLQDTKELKKIKNGILSSIKNYIHNIKLQSILSLENIVLSILCICLSRSSIIGNLFPCSIAFISAYSFIKGPSIIISLMTVISIMSVKVDAKYISICIFIYIYYMSIKNKRKTNLLKDVISFSTILFVINTVILMYNGYRLNLMLVNVFETLFIISSTFIVREVILGIKKGTFNIDSTACLISVIFISILGFKEIQLLNFSLLIYMTFFTIVFTSSYISSFAGMILGFAFGLFSFTSASDSAFYMLALGFGGVCCGILKDKHKPLSGIIFLIVSTLILLYFNNIELYKLYYKELALSILTFTIISFCFNEKLCMFSSSNNLYEKKANSAVVKLNSLADAINELNFAYTKFSKDRHDKHDKPDIEGYVNAVYTRLCSTCPQISRCWKQNYNKTYYSMAKTATNINKNKNSIDGYLKNECNNYRDVIKELYKAMDEDMSVAEDRDKSSFDNNTLLNHLVETSELISDTARSIKNTDIKEKSAKNEINLILTNQDISIKNIEIVENKKYISAILTITTHKILDDICPVISEAIKNVTGLYMKCTEKIIADDRFYILKYKTLQKIEAKSYYARLTKDNSKISGDNYAYGTVNDKFYSILCDGMGTGIQAYEESRSAIKLLVKLLNANFDELQMINTLNSLLLLKFDDDRYVTLDYSIVDYEQHELRMYKAGAAATYIISDNNVKKYKSSSLPIGILDSLECYTNSVEIKPGDIVIMMTDGVVDSINEDDLKSLDDHIELIKNKDPQSLANSLITYAVKGTDKIIDDMTVLVMKIV